MAVPLSSAIHKYEALHGLVNGDRALISYRVRPNFLNVLEGPITMYAYLTEGWTLLETADQYVGQLSSSGRFHELYWYEALPDDVVCVNQFPFPFDSDGFSAPDRQ